MIGIVNRADKSSATTSSPIQTHGNNVGALPLVASRGGGSEVIKHGKKKPGLRLWMKLDRFGKSQVLECDKNAIIKSVSIPLRDLRILGPLFSHSSNILAREKAIVVNLEFIKAIVTAQEVMLLNPLESKVVDFIDCLKQQFPIKSPTRIDDYNGTITTNQPELPFEFQILEICLETICSFLESSVLELESNAYPILDDLAMNVSTKNLERVRSLKSNLTRLLARVQKVRDEIEHLLDDNEDMAQLYLTRKEMQNQQYESLMESGASNDIISPQPNLQRLNSRTHASILSMATSFLSEDEDVEELEMLLEAYFMQLDGTRNKILSVREYIDDTEDYVNIQLDNQRNELIQLQLILTIVSFAIGINTLIAGAFAMNFKCELFEQQGLFWPFVGLTSFGSFLVLLLILAYARRKKLLGS